MIWAAGMALPCRAQETTAPAASVTSADATTAPASTPAAATRAVGVVFHDANGNRRFDEGEQPLPDVRVSNGREIVRTDAQGRYELPVDDDTILFVIKPRGWRTPLSSDMLPQFYYIHKPAGSPPSKYPGVAPTGPLPASVDFPLYPQKEPEVFKAIFFGDTQPRDAVEVHYMYHDVVEQLIGTDASFGVTLGDVAFDNLDTYEIQNRGIALIGIPWYNVIGNHDLNRSARTDADSDETFHRVFGPNYYSFDYGSVHFIALDDVEWTRPEESDRGTYRGALDADQLEFVRRDLEMIPPDQMVVLMMHIPLVYVDNRQELYRLIENRPLCVSISGHTHYQEHRFITREDGWMGPEPHHHIINVTVCGSWWSGAKDELGIPHATMSDGAPNGYSIMTFDGKTYDWEFVAARRPASHQMHIWAPETWTPTADEPTTEVLVNVFGGSERSMVEMRVEPGEVWTRLEKVARVDPFLEQAREREKVEGTAGHHPLPKGIRSPHLWRGLLPENLPAGTHRISVRTRDMFGKVYQAERLIRVPEEK